MTSNTTNRPCSVCDHIVQEVFDFLRRCQQDLVTSQAERELHAQRGGFCAFHTRQYEFLASPQGVCASYSAFLQSVGERLSAIATEALTVDEAVRALETSPIFRPTCSVCEIAKKAEEEALRDASTELAAFTANETFPLFCFAHLTALVSRCEAQIIARRLIEWHGEEYRRIAEEMRQYVAKRESLQRHLLSSEEQEAYWRGLLLLTGHKRLAVPPES